MQKIRMGMVGGGEGAFIGGLHRMAARLDGQIELVCGAFSRSAERSIASGNALGIEADRCYPSYQVMCEQELLREESERMHMVVIVTPNHLHFPVAKMALEAGFHVLSDKPATFTLAEALELEAVLDKSGQLYGLTHTYTGYPMVKEARHRVARGDLGKIRKIVVEYPQGWLADTSEDGGKQAAWRLDPAQAGISCCMGDIGVHASNLAEYISGLEISALCADIAGTVGDRVLDDDGTVLLQFNNGARGVLLASQVSVGEENSLKIRVYGELASLEWSQLEPNSLHMKFADQPSQLIRSGVGPMSPLAEANMRTPAGHPEGYIEAFANIYKNFAARIQARLSGEAASESARDVPGIREAVRGMAFIENVVAASRSDLKWHPFTLTTEHAVDHLTAQNDEKSYEKD